jgi:epoxyqueuosine reductase QueG
VCPWNKRINPDKTPEFAINEEIAGMSLEDWKNLTRDQFSRLFERSSMGRVKYEKLMSNIADAIRSGR